MSEPRRLDHPFTVSLGGVEIGSWEMSPGIDHDVEVDEVFVVLTGLGEVRFNETGEVTDLAPGVVVRLRAGESTTWTVTETLRKVYVTPLPIPEHPKSTAPRESQ